MVNYGAIGSSSGAPYQEVMDGIGQSVCMKRKLNPIEFFGIEGKNTYELFDGPSEHAADFGQSHPVELVARSGEKSGFCERCCFGPGRSATWETRRYNKSGPLLWTLEKRRHWPFCGICSRPGAQLKDSEGHLIGKIEDPCTCCSLNEDIFDASGQQVYHLEGTCCQFGLFCPCCADAALDVQLGSKGGPSVGTVSRLQLNIAECCCPTMRFRIDYPKGATAEQKVLLLGAQIMVDTVYFDHQNNNDSG